MDPITATNTDKATTVTVDESLTDKRLRITKAFMDIYWPPNIAASAPMMYDSYGAVPTMQPPLYVVDVYDSYIVVQRTSDWNTYYKVAYTDGADGASFAAMSEWSTVSPVHGWADQTKEARALFDAISTKEGRRHSTTDQSNLQSIHDMAKALGADCAADSTSTDEAKDGGFTVFKDANGRQRWVSVSSSAYEDKDEETITHKALVADVARADNDGEYGPLLWWHTKSARLGACDFNAMEGRLLVESGTFDNDEVGAAFAACKEALGISIGFRHPASEPLADGTYHTITRKERSLLPIDKSSNRVAWLVAITEKEDAPMEKEKEDKLRKLLGPVADVVLGKVKQVDDAADEAGLKHKAKGDKPSAAASVASGEAKPAPSGEAKPNSEANADPLARKLGDLTVKEFADALGAAMQPFAAKLDALGTAPSAAAEKQAGELSDLKEGFVTLAEALDERLKETDSKVDTLLGDQPRGVRNPGPFRASQSGAVSKMKSAAGGGDDASTDGQPAPAADMTHPWGGALQLVDAMDGAQRLPRTPAG